MRQSLFSKLREGRASSYDILSANVEELVEMYERGLTTVIRRISFTAPELNDVYLFLDLREYTPQ